MSQPITAGCLPSIHFFPNKAILELGNLIADSVVVAYFRFGSPLSTASTTALITVAPTPHVASYIRPVTHIRYTRPQRVSVHRMSTPRPQRKRT